MKTHFLNKLLVKIFLLQIGVNVIAAANCPTRENYYGLTACPPGTILALVQTVSTTTWAGYCDVQRAGCELDSATAPCKEGCWVWGCETVVDYYYDCVSTNNPCCPPNYSDLCIGDGCAANWGGCGLQKCDFIVPYNGFDYTYCAVSRPATSCYSNACAGGGHCYHSCNGQSCDVESFFPCYCGGVQLCYCVDGTKCI